MLVIYLTYSTISSVGSSRSDNIEHKDSAQTYPKRSTGISPENKEVLRQYATRNAHRWFSYVENAQGNVNGSQSLSIYLITGFSQIPTELVSHPSTESTASNFRRLTEHCTFIRGFKITKWQSSKEKTPDNQEERSLQNDHDSHPRTSTFAADGSSSAHSSSTAYTLYTQHKDTENVRITKVLFQNEILHFTSSSFVHVTQSMALCLSFSFQLLAGLETVLYLQFLMMMMGYLFGMRLVYLLRRFELSFNAVLHRTSQSYIQSKT